jgi:hypothetical protein
MKSALREQLSESSMRSAHWALTDAQFSADTAVSRELKEGKDEQNEQEES